MDSTLGGKEMTINMFLFVLECIEGNVISKTQSLIFFASYNFKRSKSIVQPSSKTQLVSLVADVDWSLTTLVTIVAYEWSDHS